MSPHVIVDTRGFFCPVPVIKTSDAIKTLEPGALLEVISDDPAIQFDLPAWCESNGHMIRRAEKTPGLFRFVIEKGAGGSGKKG